MDDRNVTVRDVIRDVVLTTVGRVVFGVAIAVSLAWVWSVLTSR